MIGTLILENGHTFEGTLFGYTDINDTSVSEICGEIVFQTGMVGYVESLTDPSYKEQILIYTYPIIGNYGVPVDELDEFGISKVFESNKIHINALVVQEIVDKHSHWQSCKSLSEWLKEQQVVGISGIDTRELTKIIRESGTMKAKKIKGRLEDRIANTIAINYDPVNLVKQVTRDTVDVYFNNTNHTGSNTNKIIIVDCGIKNSQIRILLSKIKQLNKSLKNESQATFTVKIVPYDYDFMEDININSSNNSYGKSTVYMKSYQTKNMQI